MVKVSEIAGKQWKTRLKKTAVVFFCGVGLLAVWFYRYSLYAGGWFVYNQIAAYFAEEERPEFFDMPTLKIGVRNHRFLKIGITLELADPEQTEYVRSMLPKLNDALISTGTSLLPQEVEDVGGLYFLKEELLYRFNLITYPSVINKLYFRRFELLP